MNDGQMWEYYEKVSQGRVLKPTPSILSNQRRLSSMVETSSLPSEINQVQIPKNNAANSSSSSQ